MEHRMRLVNFAFKEMKEGRKDIEVRLLDEKRQLINIGNRIVFTNLDTQEELKVIVTNMYVFDSFKDLFNNFDYQRIGIKENEDVTIMNNFYTEEEQKKYKALAIEVKII